MFQAPGMFIGIRNDPSPPKSALSNHHETDTGTNALISYDKQYRQTECCCGNLDEGGMNFALLWQATARR